MKQGLVGCLAFLFLGVMWGQTASGRPNVVVIYADDLGYGDVQCYNPDRGRIPTPHIDRLARKGMRFTDAHSSSAVCSPSRYTLLTGRYHWRTRLQKGIVGLWGDPLIGSDRVTIGRLAQGQGYRTACVGKWHLGWNWPIPKAELKWFRTGGYGGKKDITATEEHRKVWRSVFSQRIPGGPTAVGFDSYFGTDVPNWPPYCFIEDDRTIGLPSEFADAALFQRNQASVQGPALPGWTLEPILPTLGDRTAAFIRAEARAERPFLVYLSLTSPHTPLSVNAEWRGKSGLNLYADFVMETDAIVGQVLDAVDQSGVAEETLVLFTSDNGCAPYIDVAALEAEGHYPSGPLRGYKSDVWEGGHRVPFIVRWPELVAAGTQSDALVHQADLLATLAAIWGEALPEDAGEDSFDLMPLLTGENRVVREHAVSASIQGVPSVRSGVWKYIPRGGSGGWTKGGEEDREQLYRLSDDLAETHNLAERFPDKVRELQALFEQLIVRGRSNAGPDQANDIDVVRYRVEGRTE